MIEMTQEATLAGYFGANGLIDADEIEARLVEAWRCFNRLQGGGGGWATDGPWYLSAAKRQLLDQTDEVVGALELGEALDRVLRDPRPDRDMIKRADEASAWMMRITEDADRKLVNLAVADMGRTGRCDWRRLLKPMGLVRGSEGLRRRYRRALIKLANILNG